MPQSSPETFQAQLAIYDEHFAQACRTWSDLKEQLALSRLYTREQIQHLLASRCQLYQRMAAAPPATCAAEDRERLYRIADRPLSGTEQLVMRAKGNSLTRSIVILSGFFCPIIPLLAVRRIRELRQQAFHEWTHTLHTLEREILNLEQGLRFQKDTDEQRALRSKIASADRTIQQLQLQRDLLLARIRESESDFSDSQPSNTRKIQLLQQQTKKSN